MDFFDKFLTSTPKQKEKIFSLMFITKRPVSFVRSNSGGWLEGTSWQESRKVSSN